MLREDETRYVTQGLTSWVALKYQLLIKALKKIKLSATLRGGLLQDDDMSQFPRVNTRYPKCY